MELAYCKDGESFEIGVPMSLLDSQLLSYAMLGKVWQQLKDNLEGQEKSDMFANVKLAYRAQDHGFTSQSFN